MPCRALFVLFLLLLSAPVRADAPVVAKIVSGEELTLSDGRDVRLQGIKSAPEAAAQLAQLTANKPLTLEDASTDRYGRTSANVYIADDKGNKTWLQGELLRAGAAFVYPPVGNEPRLDEMLKIEAEACKARRGIWAEADYADAPPDKMQKRIGSFAFVRGKVVTAARVKNKVYLNFGPDWHTAFTIVIAAHDLHFFKSAGIDPLALEGKTLRARGWVAKDFRPLMTVTSPAQIEIMPQ